MLKLVMDNFNNTTSLISFKPERKVIEKNRREKMKSLYSQLFSLVPDHFKSKGAMEISEKVAETINYIKSLKAEVEKKKDTKDSRRASTLQSHCIQIHEMSPDVDVVLITGLENHSIFCNVTRVLDQCSNGIVQANFSSSGPSTFHVQDKKIEGADIYRRLNGLLNGSSKMEELVFHAPDEENIDLSDFEICSDIWFMNS